MKPKLLVAAALAALLAVAAYVWWGAPILTVRAMQTAVQSGDAEAFNAHVDYPRLRESLKDQISSLVTRQLGVEPDSANPLSALGSLVGRGLASAAVEAMVRPEVVMAVIRNGRWTLAGSAPGVPAAAPPAAVPPQGQAPAAPPPGQGTGSTPAPAQDRQIRWEIEREGASRVVAYAVDPAKPQVPAADRLGLVLERSGFADWKLAGLRLPTGAGSR